MLGCGRRKVSLNQEVRDQTRSIDQERSHGWCQVHGWGKRPQVDPHGPPTAEDAGETERQTQARESESAFDKALGRIPPG